MIFMEFNGDGTVASLRLRETDRLKIVRGMRICGGGEVPAFERAEY